MPAVERDDGRWSTLLSELLVSILQRVPTVRDRIRIGSACSWWRSVLTEARHLLPPTAPLLLLPYSEEEDGSHPRRREVRGIPSNWIHRVLLPDSQYWYGCHRRPKKVICGSSMGWLLVIDGGRDVHLWNPATGEEIPLPRNFFCRHEFCVDKVVLSSAPQGGGGGCTVMILRKHCLELSFCRIGDDDRWTTFEARHPLDWGICYQDVICYRGRFCAVTYGGGVVTLDVLGPDPKMAVAADCDWYNPINHRRTGPDNFACDSFKNYLVESSGELLRVTRLTKLITNSDYNNSYKKRKLVTNSDDNERRRTSSSTVMFQVHKLDLDTKKWSKVVSLGDRALFLGKSSSVSFAATAVDGHKRNCIYFLDDDYDPCFPSCSRKGDMGVFDLEDGRIKNCWSPNHCPQFWIHLSP